MDVNWDDGLDEQVAFARLFRPWVEEAAASLRPGPSVGPGARASLTRSLLDRLSQFGALAALQSFRSTDVPYHAFVRSGPATLIADHPGFVALAERLCRHWVGATQILVDRVAADLAAVAPGATAVVDISPRLGDPHRGAHHVAAVVTDTGRQWYLKPRSVAAEVAFFGLASRAPGLLRPADVPELHERQDAHGDYGWMSPVVAGPVDDAPSYWHRVGRMLRVLQVAGVTDLHQSNVICTGAQLVPVDLECITTPELIGRVGPGADTASRFARDSVAFTGLLPRSLSVDGPIAVDWSGLLGRPGQLNGRWRPRWAGLGTDAIRRDRAPMRTPRSSNLAFDAGERLVDIDLDALLRGYEAEWEHWSKATFPFDDFAALSARVLFRPTAVYAALTAELMEPENLARPDAIDETVARLPEFDSALIETLGSDLAAELGTSEQEALRRLDVPIFHVTAGELLLDDGTPRPFAPGRSGLERTLARLERASDRAWRSAEVAVVRVALEQGGARCSSSDAAGDAPVPVMDAVRSIAADLATAAVALDDGRVGWPEAVPEGSAGRLRLSLAPPGIYHGGSGIAVFLAAVASVTGDAAAEEVARRALGDGPSEHESPWLQSGWSGWAWAAAAIGELLDDGALGRSAADIIADRMPTDFAADEPLDLIGGWAGAVAAAASVARRTGDDAAIERAVDSGVALARAVRSRLADEIAARDVLRLGMAHGSTGVLHALGAAMTLRPGDHALLEVEDTFLLLRSLEDERVARRDGIGGRIDQPGGQRVPSRTWCWGVSGFVLARSAPWLPTRPETANGSPLAVSFAALADGSSRHGHLCCGLAGHLDAAIAARGLGLAGAASVVADRVDRLSTTAHGAPFSDGTDLSGPSLFRGRAGVGLALLRATVDDRLPTPLLP